MSGKRGSGIEPATSSLGSWRSTTELFPRDGLTIPQEQYLESLMDRKALKEMLAEEGLIAKEAKASKQAAGAYRSYQFEKKKALKLLSGAEDAIHSMLSFKVRWDQEEGDPSVWDSDTFDYIEGRLRDVKVTLEDL